MIETIYSDPDFLAHHGVKGMKWGVRRRPEVDPDIRNKVAKKMQQIEDEAHGGKKIKVNRIEAKDIDWSRSEPKKLRKSPRKDWVDQQTEKWSSKLDPADLAKEAEEYYKGKKILQIKVSEINK